MNDSPGMLWPLPPRCWDYEQVWTLHLPHLHPIFLSVNARPQVVSSSREPFSGKIFSFEKVLELLFMFILWSSVHMCGSVCAGTNVRSQGTTFRSQFSSTLWVPGWNSQYVAWQQAPLPMELSLLSALHSTVVFLTIDYEGGFPLISTWMSPRPSHLWTLSLALVSREVEISLASTQDDGPVTQNPNFLLITTLVGGHCFLAGADNVESSVCCGC